MLGALLGLVSIQIASSTGAASRPSIHLVDDRPKVGLRILVSGRGPGFVPFPILEFHTGEVGSGESVARSSSSHR